MASSNRYWTRSAAKGSSYKRKRGLSEVVNSDDRLSNLPDSILCHILSFLPTKEVIATSLLSRRWEFLWTEVCSFHFEDFDECRSHSDIMKKKSFVKFVDRVLLLRNVQNLDKFCLKWKYFCESIKVSRWVNIAVANNARVLDVLLHCARGSCSGLGHKLPRSLFTCDTLEFLELSGDIVIDAPNVVYFPRLVTLNLVRVVFKSNDSFQKLIAGCAALKFLSISRNTWNEVAITISSPVLKRLELKPYEEILSFFSPYDFGYKDTKLEIIAPALQYLYLQDCVSQDFIFGSLTSLEEACVDVSCYSPAEISHCNSVVKLLGALHHVKLLRFSYDTSKALNGATNHLSTKFKRLTTLVVEVYCSKWKFLPELLENCVNLQVLELCKPSHLYCQETHNGCWRTPKQFPSCLLSSLREIFVGGFTGLEDELAMIRYVLKYGRVLKKIELRSGLCADDFKKKFELLQKILMFPRKSSTCVIAFS